MTNTQMIEQAIDTIRKATMDLNRAITTTTTQASSEAKSLDTGFRDLLAELVSSHDDSADHFKRFASETGKDWEKQSTECRSDWSRICERRRKAEDALLHYARALMKAEKNVA
jgi:hypothetical protein